MPGNMEKRGLCHCHSDEYLQMFCFIYYSLFKWNHVYINGGVFALMLKLFLNTTAATPPPPQIVILQQSLLTADTFSITLLDTSHNPSLAHLGSLPPLGVEENPTFWYWNCPSISHKSVMIWVSSIALGNAGTAPRCVQTLLLLWTRTKAIIHVAF